MWITYKKVIAVDIVDNIPLCYKHVIHIKTVDITGRSPLINISTGTTTTTAIYLNI